MRVLVPRAGGLCGMNSYRSYIQNCYSVGAVSASECIGGLVGLSESSYYVLDSLWDYETSGVSQRYGTALATVEMMKQQTFIDVGWDFIGEPNNGTADIWLLCKDGTDYPRLSWEFGADYDCLDGVLFEELLYPSCRWLEHDFDPYTPADRTGDGAANFHDYAVLSESWLEGVQP